MDNAKNFAKVQVDGDYDDVATSIDLILGEGAKLPTPPFNAVWWNSTDFADPADDINKEIVRVTAIVGDTLTVVRGQEGTAGIEHNIGLDNSKLYRMSAGFTALNANMLVPIFYDGTTFYIIKRAIQFGDILSEGNGTILEIDDVSSLINLNAVDVVTGGGFRLANIPDSDPEVVGQLYYDPVTNVVKRSAG